ncbi:hypothetical protein QTP70_003021, partial [Hemibagrus guttatus]
AVDSSITPDQTIISSSEGSIITLTCTYDDSAYNLYWYRQKPHSEPEFLLLTSKYTDGDTKAAHDPRISTKVRKKEKKVGCELEEKERFWSELDEVMESIPTGERVVIGADFNGHVGEGNTADEEVMGKFGVKERNLEGQMVVDFAKRMDMGVVNTYFQKREEHRVTYKSGGRRTQVDYILCRRGNLKEISDCKVVVGESVVRQHRMVVCRMTLMVCKTKRSKIEKKTKWWKLKKEECCEEFRQKLRQALGGQVVLPDDWETTAEVIRETGRKVLGVSSGRRKEDKETWWWNEEVQDSIQRKRLAKKKWDMDRTEENRQEYKELQRRVKREVSKAKQKAYEELYTRLDTREGEKDLYRLARQRDRDGKDVQQKVDKIRKDEVRKALKRMKSWKAVGPDDIPVEVWKCLGEAAVEFLANLFNRVLENLEKAYKRVPREELWYCMRKSGVAGKYVRVVQDMYERSRTVVRCAVGQTEEFNVEVGLHQGSALSPFLFAIVMDQLSGKGDSMADSVEPLFTQKVVNEATPVRIRVTALAFLHRHLMGGLTMAGYPFSFVKYLETHKQGEPRFPKVSFGARGAMDNASDYGSEDSRFDSWLVRLLLAQSKGVQQTPATEFPAE